MYDTTKFKYTAHAHIKKSWLVQQEIDYSHIAHITHPATAYTLKRRASAKREHPSPSPVFSRRKNSRTRGLRTRGGRVPRYSCSVYTWEFIFTFVHRTHGTYASPVRLCARTRLNEVFSWCRSCNSFIANRARCGNFHFQTMAGGHGFLQARG